MKKTFTPGSFVSKPRPNLKVHSRIITDQRLLKKYTAYLKAIKLQSQFCCIILAFTSLINMQYVAAQEVPEMVKERVKDEVIVTAERFESSAQDIAASLTVFDRANLERSDITSIQELGRYIPNVLLTNQGSPRFSVNSVRGISSTVRADYFSQTIGIYIDDVPVSAAEYSSSISDVKQIEVLRGPQGTLYGRNTPGGVINITTRTADHNRQSKVEARIGNNGQQGISALMSGPIIDGLLSGKVFLDYLTRDGFTDYFSNGQSIDDVRSVTGSTALNFSLGDKTRVTLSASIEDIKQGAYAFQAFDDFEKRLLDIESPNNEDREIQSFTINANHDFDSVSFQSITGLRYYDVTSNQDIGYNPVVTSFGGGRSESIEKGDQFSQEIRFSGMTDDQRLRWLIGGFYSSDSIKYDYLFDLPAFGSPSLSSSIYDKQEFATFGEATATLFERLDLTVGLRASKDSHELVNNMGADNKIDFNIITPKLRAAYRLDDNYQVYGLASRGSRTGGFNRFSAGANFKPEYLWNYELGLKSQWLDNTLTVNAAVFHIDWNDQQVVTLIGPGSVEIANAGEASNFGGELELSWAINSNFSLSGFVGFNNGEYDVLVNERGADLSGNHLVNTPEISGGVSTEYRFPIFNSSLFAWIRPEFTFTGDHFFDVENRLLQESYSLLNLNFGVEGERISVSGFVKNVFDQDYRSYGYTDSLSNFDLAVAGEFRTFGIKIKTQF